MAAIKIAESLIHKNAPNQSYERGKDYVRSRAVSNLVLRDQVLQASVAGSEYYCVRIEFKEHQVIQSATCSCPYDIGGWCKHIVATLLVAIDQPNIEERPSLTQLLERLSLDQTRKLLHNLVKESPDLVDFIDIQVELLTASPPTKLQPSKSSAQTSQKQTENPVIDRAPFRRQLAYALKKALRGYEYSYDEDDPFTDIIDAEIEKAKVFQQAGDSFRAFVMLYAIAEELCDYTEEIENYMGDASDIVYNLDLEMAEAILCTDFSVKERQKWTREIKGVQDSLRIKFDLSLAALSQGWDDPYLEAMLQGKEKPHSLNALEPDWDNLGYIRLQILQAQESFEEYLNFAKAANFFSAHVIMLLRLKRYDEAIAIAKNVQDEDAAFAIAKELLEQSLDQEALYIANRGLQLQEEDAKRYRSRDLAVWTAVLAERLGEIEILLNAKIIAFKLKPSLSDYHKIRDLTKDKWHPTKEVLLKYLTGIDSFAASEAMVSIFLEEGLIDQAIAIADSSYCDSSLRLLVMKAVANTNSQWVVSKAKALAEDIITRGKSDAYEEAVSWLEQVRNAYRAVKQNQEWLNYRSQLVEANGRKRKLMELINRKGL